MTWSIPTPFWLFLPLLISLVIHVFLSAGFLLSIRQRILRVLVYVISCLFFLAYFIVFNQNLILATTKVQIDFPSRYLKYEDYYGAERIPAEKIQAVALRDGSESTGIWVQCEERVFYLDKRFPRLDEFVPLLQSIVDLAPAESAYGYTVHRANNYENILNFKSKDDPLAGGAKYFFPWLAVFTLVAYPMGNKAWQGKFRYFQVLGLSYYIPTLIICAFFQPSLPLAFFLLFYPAYLLFLTAMCLPDNEA